MHYFLLFIFSKFKLEEEKHKFINKTINMKYLNIKKTKDKYKIVASNKIQIKFFHLLLKTYMLFKNNCSEIENIKQYIYKKREFNINSNFKSLMSFYYNDIENITEMVLRFINIFYPKNKLLNNFLRNFSYDVFLIIFIKNYRQKENILFFKNNYDILRKLQKIKNAKEFLTVLEREIEYANAGGFALLNYDKHYNDVLNIYSKEIPIPSLNHIPYMLFFIYKKNMDRHYIFQDGYFLYLHNKQKYLKKYDNGLFKHIIINQDNQIYNYSVTCDDCISYSELIKN